MRWFAVLLGLALVSTLGLGFGADRAAAHAGDSIDIWFAWNGALNDSDGDGLADLTYSIAGGGSLDQATVRAALEDWDTELAGLELNEVSSRDKTANIKVRLQGGGGVIAGSAKANFDRNGFAKSVDLKITLKSFGVPSDQDTVGEITRHEAGHALGLSHANFNDLMDPTVGGVATISACDVDGVVAAQHWKLVDGSSTPHQPHVTHVHC